MGGVVKAPGSFGPLRFVKNRQMLLAESCITLRFMKKIRLFILLILSITLPSLGLASMNLMAQCNLMTETTSTSSTTNSASMAEMADMSAMSGSMDNCMTSKTALSSSHGKQQSGQTCKFGSNCNLNTIPTSFAPLTLSSPYQADVLPTPESPFSPPLKGQWRPPRL